MTTLRQGDRGPKVLELQCLLAFTGNDPGPLDGIFGPRTHSAWCSQRDAWTMGGPISGVHEADLDVLRRLPRRAVEVPRILTPVSAVEMRIALVAGYASTFGDIAESLTSGALAVRVALAQLCVEHGCEPWGGPTWRKLERQGHLPPVWLCPGGPDVDAYIYVWNDNVGNRQVTREDRGFAQSGPEMPTVPWFRLPAPEGEGANVRTLTSACYAFANLAEGAAAYWRFLRDKCGPALAAFERGDPAAAAHELKVGAWSYSGSEEVYARGMRDRFRLML